jgi:hypothetical protein
MRKTFHRPKYSKDYSDGLEFQKPEIKRQSDPVDWLLKISTQEEKKVAKIKKD